MRFRCVENLVQAEQRVFTRVAMDLDPRAGKKVLDIIVISDDE